MRSQLLFGSVLSLGLLLVAAACSSTEVTTSTPATPDAGTGGKKPSTSSSSGDVDTDAGEEEEEDSGTTSSSSGGTTNAFKSDTLATGSVQLLGLAGDDAIYAEFGQSGDSLKAVPIAGGAPTKIADLGADDQPAIAGAALAIWTGQGNRATLNVWTRATGLKAGVATDSVPGLFAASPDGSRIAFSMAATEVTPPGGQPVLESTQIGIRDTASDTNAAVLSGTTASGNAANLRSDECSPDWGFVGKVFIAAHCIGVSDSATNAKLLLVPDGATVSAKRLDAATAASAPTLFPFWYADSAASKVLGIAATNKQAKVFPTVAGSVVNIDTTVEQAVMLQDGSAVVYLTTDGTLKKAATADAAKTTLSDGVAGLLAFSGDEKKILFNKLAPAPGDPRRDINLVDLTATSPAPVAIEATATVVPAGFNGGSSHVLFLGAIGATGATLKSMPVAGGAAKDIVSGTSGARALGAGNGVVFLSNAKKIGPTGQQITVYDINHVDAVAGGKAGKINDSMPQGQFRVKGKRVVYAKLAQTGSGIYAVTLP